jgi:Pilus assembly protein, PilO
VTRTQTLLVSLVAAVAVLFGYWHFVLQSKRDQAAALETDIATHQASLQQAEATVAQYAKERDSYKVNYSTLVRLGKALPADDDVRSLLVQLSDTAHKTGVDFRSISVGGGSGDGAPAATISGSSNSTPPGATSLGAGISQLPFSFSFNGRFANLGGFLSQLEREVRVQEDKVAVTGRLLRIDSIQLAPGGGGYPTIAAKISASSYLAEPTSPVTTAPAAGAAGSGAQSSSSGTSTASTTTATVTGAVR